MQTHPKGSFEVQPQQTAQYLETFHRQDVSHTSDGWHVWIWLELLKETETLGKTGKNKNKPSSRIQAPFSYLTEVYVLLYTAKKKHSNCHSHSL